MNETEIDQHNKQVILAAAGELTLGWGASEILDVDRCAWAGSGNQRDANLNYLTECVCIYKKQQLV